MPRMSSKPPVRAAALLLVLALATGCGPSTREASIAVLIAAGAIVVLANAIVGLLWLLWRRVRPELRFRWQPFATVGLVLSGLGLLADSLATSAAVSEWLAIALWAAGTSYLTLFLLVWRIRLPAPAGLAWAHAIASTVLFLPALPFAFAGSNDGELADALLFLWIIPGYGGFVSGPLFGLLLIEALVRWGKLRSRTAA
jgi:hypothetical protein